MPFCTVCGYELTDEDAYCGSCGAPTPARVAAAAPAAPSYAPPPAAPSYAPPPGAPAPAPRRKGRGCMVAVLVLVLLGCTCCGGSVVALSVSGVTFDAGEIVVEPGSPLERAIEPMIEDALDAFFPWGDEDEGGE